MRSLDDLFRNFMQVGYVTDDIDVAAAFFESKLGTVECVKHYKASMGGGRPPAAGVDAVVPWVIVDGQPAEEWLIDVLLVNAGPTNLEVICPVGGSVDLYRDAVRPGVPASMHHLGFRVDDFDEASAVVEASGRSWKQYGVSGGIRMGYLDLRAELGHFVEIMELDEESAEGFSQLEALANAKYA